MLDNKSYWLERANFWQHRLIGAGLYGPAQAIAEAFRPLAPLAAQLLWFAQPAFTLIGKFDRVGGLAELLDDPDNLRLPVDPPGTPEQTEDR
jgi:hypothetical protein